MEPGELERKFARLAAQGWLLEKCTYGTYTYRRGEPNGYEYRVQYIYESRDGQRADYVKTLADMGVEKVGDMGSFLVLRKRADGAPFTLYSDLDAQIMDARRLMRIKIILAVAFALLAADWFYNTWVWYDLAVSFDAMYADLRETYHQPSFLSLRLWGKHIIWYAVLGVLLAIIIKTFATGACSEDMLGSFICAGIGGAFMAQIFVNVGMNLRLLPVIGVTLPFYSAGGSSVLMLYICVGLVLSVYMHNTKSLFG